VNSIDTTPLGFHKISERIEQRPGEERFKELCGLLLNFRLDWSVKLRRPNAFF
jgi:hypothetical protein